MFKSLEGSSSKHAGRIVRKKGDLITCEYVGALDGLGMDYFTYTKELHKILRLKKVGTDFNRMANRAIFSVWDKKEKQQLRIYASHLARGCYDGCIKAKTLVKDIKAWEAFRKESSKRQTLVVDHLDDNPHNNTIYNLSFMTSAENNIKKDIISKIKEPSACMLAYVNGEYRVRLFLHENARYFLQEYYASPERRAAMLALSTPETWAYLGRFEERYTCHNVNELLACLRREVTKYRKHTAPLRKKHRGSYIWLKTPSNAYWASNIEKAIKYQGKIANMDWTDAKPVLALRKGDRNKKYFKILKDSVEGLPLKPFQSGKYRIARKEVIV